MKKLTILTVVFILLAVSVVPVMAAGNQSNGHGNGNGNGHGNGVSAGQTNNKGNGDQTKDRDQTQDRDQVRLSAPGRSANHSAIGIRNSTRMRTPFYLQGVLDTITGTNPMTITVSLTHGNAQVKEYINTTLDIRVTSSTMVYKITQDTEASEGNTNDDEGVANRVPVPLADLDKYLNKDVAIHGNVVDGVFTARLITIYIRAPLGETVENP